MSDRFISIFLGALLGVIGGSLVTASFVAPSNLVAITADAGVAVEFDAGYVVVEGRDMIAVPQPDEWLTPDEAMAYACAGEWPDRLRHLAPVDVMSVSVEACDAWRGARALRLLSGANMDAGPIVGSAYEVMR